MRLLAVGYMLVLILCFAAATPAQDSILAVAGPASSGLGVVIGQGDILVTSERLGSPLLCDGKNLEPLLSRPVRGISLWKVEPRFAPMLLADKPLPSKSERFLFLTPNPVRVETIEVTTDPVRWQIGGEVWLARSALSIPSGAALIRESDRQVVGLAVNTIDGITVVATADQIRLTCFDAGVVLHAHREKTTGPRILHAWPYSGSSDKEFHLSDMRRLEAWRDVAGLLPTYQSGLVAARDFIYFGDRDGRIFCVDSRQRSLVWSQNLEWPIIFPPVVEGDIVYVTVFGLVLEMKDNSFIFRHRHWAASGVGILYAFDRHSGEIRWRHISGLRASVLPHDDRVYFGGLSGYGALNARTGRSLWIQEKPLKEEEFPFWYVLNPPLDKILPVLAVRMRLREKVPRRVLQASGEVKLLLVDTDDGTVEKTIKLGSVADSYHPFATACYLLPDNSRLVLAVGKLLRGYGLPEGKMLWERSLPGTIVPGSLCSGDQVIVPLDKPAIQSFDMRTGKMLWSFEELTAAPGSLLLHGNTIFFGALDSRIYCLSAQTGKCEWSLECPGGKISGAPVLLNDLLYVAASDGRIYAVSPPR